jgi:uncharacterized membrane protein
VTLPQDTDPLTVAPEAASTLGETATGLSPRLAAALAYAAWWLTGLLFLAVEPRNPFVRYHARQAVVVFGFVWLAGIALSALSFVGVFLAPGMFWITAALAQATWILGVVLWILCLVQAARGRWWSVPLASRLPGA